MITYAHTFYSVSLFMVIIENCYRSIIPCTRLFSCSIFLTSTSQDREGSYWDQRCVHIVQRVCSTLQGCSVHWGMSSCVLGVVQYSGGYHECIGGYQYCGTHDDFPQCTAT